MDAGGEQFVDRPGAEAGHPQQLFARGAVHVEREEVAMLQRPGELRVDVERQIAALFRRARHLARGIAVKAHHPVGLVEPVLAEQRRADERQHGARIRDRRESRIIDPAQAETVVERGGSSDDGGVRRGIRAHDHLRGLAGGGETGC